MPRIKKVFMIECDESAENWLFADNLTEILNSVKQDGGPYEVSDIKDVMNLPIPNYVPNRISKRGLHPTFSNFMESMNNLAHYTQNYWKFKELKEKMCSDCPKKAYCFKKCEEKK